MIDHTPLYTARRLRQLRHTGIAICLSVVLSTSLLHAQPKPERPNKKASDMATTIIDGAATPDLIPDNVAFALFFTAASPQPGMSNDEMARQRALLAPARLSDADILIFQSAIADFQSQMQALAGGRLMSGAAAVTQPDSIVTALLHTLSQRMSSDGMWRLLDFIRTQKKNMKVSAASGMSTDMAR